MSEIEGGTRLEMVSEAETFATGGLDLDVWPPTGVEDDIADGLERVLALAEIGVSEEGIAEIGVKVP